LEREGKRAVDGKQGKKTLIKGKKKKKLRL